MLIWLVLALAVLMLLAVVVWLLAGPVILASLGRRQRALRDAKRRRYYARRTD